MADEAQGPGLPDCTEWLANYVCSRLSEHHADLWDKFPKDLRIDLIAATVLLTLEGLPRSPNGGTFEVYDMGWNNVPSESQSIERLDDDDDPGFPGLLP